MHPRILIAAALAATLLAGSATACSHEGQMKQPRHQGLQNPAGMQGAETREPVHKHFVKKVIAAVSKSGIDASQAKRVTEAVNTFKTAKMQLMKNPPLPLDAFKNDTFDKARFTEILLSKPTAAATAKGDLLESIYTILDKEQRKIFTREFTAPMVEKMITRDMIRGHMMQPGGHCGGKGPGRR